MSDYTQRNYTFSVFFTQCELGKCNFVNSFKRWWPRWRSVDRETVARRPHPHPHIISPAGKFVSYNPPTSQLFTYNPLHSRDTEHSKEFQWDKTKDQDVRFWQTLSRTPCKHGKYLTNFTIFDNSDFVTFYWLEWKKTLQGSDIDHWSQKQVIVFIAKKILQGRQNSYAKRYTM